MNKALPDENVIEREGCPNRYWLTGPQSAPLVVLTHGATLDHRMFDAQLPVLAQAYRVLTWDMRGHGVSQPLLLVHGDHDKLGNIAKIAAVWAARDPHCRYVVIPDAGHCSNQDNPGFFNKVPLDFLHETNPAAVNSQG